MAVEDQQIDRLDSVPERNLNEWTWCALGASATILAIHGVVHAANLYTPPEERFGAPSNSVSEVIVEGPTALYEEPYQYVTDERVTTLPADKVFSIRHGVYSYTDADGMTWRGMDQRDLGLTMMLEVMPEDSDGVVWYQVG